MIETPRGVLAADTIAATPGITALVAGTNDLAADLRARGGGNRGPLLYALSRIVLAARAVGILAIDGVCNAIDDRAALRREAEQGLAFGFDGKSVIHPSQVEPVNTVFAPNAADVAAAHALIAAHDAGDIAGYGVVAHYGMVVEALHVAAAHRLLARAQAIARR